MKSRILRIMLPAALLMLSGCNFGFQTMGASEYAVVFSALPRFIGGGLRSKLLQPGEMEFLMPWETLYRMDTSVQSISWGAVGSGDKKDEEDYVETRALDGNEVGLSVTVQYHIIPDKLHHIIQKVGQNLDDIRQLVEATARADIRTHMNVLNTRDFFNPTDRQAAVDHVRMALNQRLEPEGVDIDKVIYNDHRFERRLPDGSYDRSYQEQIDKTQAINQQTKQEEKKIKTVVERKRQEFNEAQARVNRIIEEVEGYKRQATLRGDAYLEAQKNQAEEILAVGRAEVEGLRKQVAALQGPGGKALLKLSLVEALVKQNPRFVLLNSGADGRGGNGLDVTRVDANELIRQAGIALAAQEASASSKPAEKDASTVFSTPARSEATQ